MAIGRAGGTFAAEQALAHVWGYAVGNDLTRRDLQAAAKKKGRPWDTGKGFDARRPIAPLRPAAAGHIDRGRIWLSVNGELRQESDVREMIWKTSADHCRAVEAVRAASRAIWSSPARRPGVGALRPGDRLEGGIEGLESFAHTIGAAVSVLKLYTYFRSSAAFRTRIALNLKGVRVERISVDLRAAGERAAHAEFLAVNPQGLVPALDCRGHHHPPVARDHRVPGRVASRAAAAAAFAARSRARARDGARGRLRHAPAQQSARAELSALAARAR